MTMSEYLSDRLGTIMLQAVFAVAAAGFLYVTGTEGGVILLLVIFWLLVFLCARMTEFFKCRARLQELENIMNGLDEKYLFAECIPRGSSVYERRLMELSRRAGRAMIGAVSDARAAQREYREYVESWVHEIKTPITAAGLICRNMDSETRRKLAPELAQIEAHVERALFYARAESPEKDFIIRRFRLSDIVDEAVERHRALLIQSGISVKEITKLEKTPTSDIKLLKQLEECPKQEFFSLDICAAVDDMTGIKNEHTDKAEGNSGSDMEVGLEHVIYTDDKWAVFILGQLLQNAARYRREDPGGQGIAEDRESAPVITLSAKRLGRQVQLAVSDNGIGIPAHELSRVFDRGFTGSNGRVRGGSTGMGLYLCRRLADCLEMGLQIASKEGQGTTVTLTFPAKEGQ